MRRAISPRSGVHRQRPLSAHGEEGLHRLPAPLRGRHEGAAQEPQEDATRALPHCQVQPRRGNGHAEYMVIWEVFAVFRIPIPQWFESGSNSINLYPQ